MFSPWSALPLLGYCPPLSASFSKVSSCAQLVPFESCPQLFFWKLLCRSPERGGDPLEPEAPTAFGSCEDTLQNSCDHGSFCFSHKCLSRIHRRLSANDQAGFFRMGSSSRSTKIKSPRNKHYHEAQTAPYCNGTHNSTS